MTDFDLKGTLDRLLYFVVVHFVALAGQVPSKDGWADVFGHFKEPTFWGLAVAAAFGLSAVAQKVKAGDRTAAIGNATPPEDDVDD